MDILLHLATHAGIIVGKDTLLQAVWPDRVVEDNNLTVHMTALRKALGPEGTDIIQTVTGRGYLFTGTADAPPAAAPIRQRAVPALTAPRPPARLIGRDAALSELRTLLQARRIVTIVGPGGVGKTSLALQLVADQAPSFADGAAFTDLSSITDPVRLPEAIMAVLAGGAGAGTNSVTEQLISILCDRQLLLMLDNCEHLVAHVAALAIEVARTCPGVVILLTSREGLFIEGEQIFRLAPLPVPADPATTNATTALDYDAVRLFAERAETANGFRLDDINAPIVATICARLDGIPLAIEMAAARLKILSLAQLSARLDERFRLLTAPGRGTVPRHRTLQAVIDWSYDLLPPTEQALLRVLSIFANGADLAAIEAAAITPGDAGWELLDRLTSLADKSMVSVDRTSEHRVRLLETVRQYAAGKLRDAGEIHLFARHAAVFADRFARAAQAWPLTSGTDWLRSVAADVDNLRGALAWCFGPDGDPALGLRATACTVPLWWELSETPLAEGQRWFETGAAHLTGDTPDVVRAWIRFGQSWRDFRFGDRENLAAAAEAVALFRAAGDAAGLGAALWRAGSALLTRETADQAEALLTEAETVLRQIPAGKWLALTLIRLADLRFRQGQHAEALAYYREGFALSRATQFWIGLVNGGSNMAELLFAQGEADRALRQLRDLRAELPPSRRTPLMATLSAHLLLAGHIAEMREVAAEALDQGDAVGLTAALAWTIEAVALLCGMAGNAAEAAKLAGYARAVHPSLATRAGSRKIVLERLNALFAKALEPGVLTLALAEGGGWNVRAATARARAVLRTDYPAPLAADLPLSWHDRAC